MSKDIKTLIQEEIGNIDEMLKAHAYHRQALKELLDKMSDVVVATPAVQAKSNKLTNFRKRCREFAVEVANLVAKEKLTKAGAIRKLIEDGVIDRSLESAQAMVAPANIGKRFHNKIFEGTRYGKQG